MDAIDLLSAIGRVVKLQIQPIKPYPLFTGVSFSRGQVTVA